MIPLVFLNLVLTRIDIENLMNFLVEVDKSVVFRNDNSYILGGIYPLE
jgi:hypothetical protein